MRIGYITDLEGNLELWHRSIDLSEVLRRGADRSLELCDDAAFVFGGDAVDHGPGDLQILKDLVGLKKRYPDRVHLLVGNRDVNKIRLMVELADEHCAAVPLSQHPGVYWNTPAKPAACLSEPELNSETMAMRLQWILARSMNAPKAFESRKQELSRFAGGEVVDDAAVVKSFQEYVRPGGLMFEYLSLAKLAIVLDGVLFVHAGLPRAGDVWTPGWCPGGPGEVPKLDVPLLQWIDDVESFRAQAWKQIVASDAFPPGPAAWFFSGGYDHAQPGSGLLQYMMSDTPEGTRQPSIMCNGFLDDSSQPMQPDEATLSWLQEGGVRCVVCGHKPHGDAPFVMRIGRGIDAITADITYASNVKWSDMTEPRPSVGSLAVCEVVLGPTPCDARAHGYLSDGSAFEAKLADQIIGKSTKDGWRVKGRATESGKLVLSKNIGWDFSTRLVATEEVVIATEELGARIRARDADDSDAGSSGFQGPGKRFRKGTSF